MRKAAAACVAAGVLLATPARAFFFIEASTACWPVDSCYTPTASIDLELLSGETRTLPATSMEWAPGYEPSCFFFHFSYEDPELDGAFIPVAHFSLVCDGGWAPGVSREYETQTVTCGWYWIPVWCHPVVPCEAFQPWPGCEACAPAAFTPRLTAALLSDSCLLLSWTRHPNPGLFRIDEAPALLGPWTPLLFLPDTTLTLEAQEAVRCYRVTQVFD